MKKFILTIVLLISSVFLFAQDYPRLETDSAGNKVVVMTIEQAQKIDNNLDIFKLLKLQGSECDSLSMSYIKVIDKLGNQVALLEFNNKTLKEQITSKDTQISNLQERLKNAETSDELCEDQKLKKDEEIKLLKKEVLKQKIQKVIGFAVGAVGVIGITLVYLGVL